MTNGADRFKAFTLIETLVLVAVIGLICVIMISAVGGLLARAQGAKCTSNLRQIGSLFQIYAQENDGRMPRTDQTGGTTAWFQGLYPLIGLTNMATGQSIFRCPTRMTNDTTGHYYGMEFSAGVGPGTAAPSVKMNSLIANNGGIDPANGMRWLVIEAGWHIIRAGNAGSANPRTAVRLRHGDRATVLFPNMSVRQMKKDEINEELYLFHNTPIP